jgi:mono/diheme cytochrome c family protein
VVLSLVLAPLAQNAPPRQDSAPAGDQALIQQGEETFSENCATCHGDDATGGRGPDLTHAKSVQQDNHGELLTPILKNGIPDKKMPNLSLTADEINGLIAYLHSIRAPAQNANSLDCAGSRTPGPGDAESGKAYFDGKCAGCHSAGGDLHGIGSKYPLPGLQAHVLCPEKTPVATIIVSSGEKYSGAVVQNDESDIAIRDAAGKVRSWPKHEVKVETQDVLAVHQEALQGHSDSDLDNLLAYLGSLK